MKAALCLNYGAPEVLTISTANTPSPQDNEVLIKIVATAVNSGDVRVRALAVEGFLKVVMRFVLGFSKPRKPILGNVLSGVVEKVGSRVTQFKAGDEVFAQTGFQFGTYAEYATVKESGAIALKPVKASFEKSAAILFGGSTAIHFLRKAKIDSRPNQTVMIYGATGAVGTSAIQIAKFYGAHVTAVCSSAGVQLAKSLGATDVLDYTKGDFTKTGKTYDIIFDAVGKTRKKNIANCLSAGGRFVTVGGVDVALETKEQLLFLKELFDNGNLKAAIDKTFSLEDIVEAHRYVDSGRKKGNVVVKI